jgi:hypothetical protein
VHEAPGVDRFLKKAISFPDASAIRRIGCPQRGIETPSSPSQCRPVPTCQAREIGSGHLSLPL